MSHEDFKRVARELGVDVATARAVAEVEASGQGFLPDGRPRILYEAHIFHRESGGKYADAKDNNGVPLSASTWDRSLYGSAGAHQWDRLNAAAALDWDAAHKAASWGMFQILGQNHRMVGYPTVKDFVDAMNSGAGARLDMFVQFVKRKGLAPALQGKDWTVFARGYNGPGYAANRYDTKLAEAYSKHATA